MSRSPTVGGTANPEGVSRALSCSGGQAGQFALWRQIPQPRRQAGRELTRVEQGRRLLVRLDAEKIIEQHTRLLVVDGLVVVPKVGQLGCFLDSVLEVADLVDQPVFL